MVSRVSGLMLGGVRAISKFGRSYLLPQQAYGRALIGFQDQWTVSSDRGHAGGELGSESDGVSLRRSTAVECCSVSEAGQSAH